MLKKVGTEIQMIPFGEIEFLTDAEIHVGEPGCGHDAYTGVAESAGGRQDKRVTIEIPSVRCNC